MIDVELGIIYMWW